MSKQLCLGFLLSILVLLPTGAAAQPAIDCETQLLGSSHGNELFSVDLATGAGTLIGLMPSPLATEIEYDILTDTLWAEEPRLDTELHTIDPTTGASLTTVTHNVGALAGLEFVGDVLYGTFHVTSGPASPSDLVIVDTTTGALSVVGTTGWGPISGLAYDEGTGTMYGVTAGSSAAVLLTIDLNTGTGTSVGPLLGAFVGSIEFGPDGVLYGGGTTNGANFEENLLRIDTSTGAATVVGDTGFSITGLTSCSQGIASIAEIPILSDSAMALLCLILLGLGVAILRR